MNFFKENNDEGQIIPTFPTGNGCVESCEDGLEAIHPGVCSFHNPAFTVHLLIEQIFVFSLSSISSVRAYVGNDIVTVKCSTETLPVKAGIKIAEKTVSTNARFPELLHKFVYPLFNLIKVSMVAALRFGHGQRKSVSVTKIEGISSIPLLPTLIFNHFISAICSGMGAIYMGKGQIHLILVCLKKFGKDAFPFSGLAPFAIMVENRFPAWCNTTEQMTCGKHSPLTSAFQLEENGVNNLYQVKFCLESSFCDRKIGHNSISYCIFVKYSVFWHRCNLLKFGDYNIVLHFQDALYFIYFTEFLTSQNKFRQLQYLKFCIFYWQLSIIVSFKSKTKTIIYYYHIFYIRIIF